MLEPLFVRRGLVSAIPLGTKEEQRRLADLIEQGFAMPGATAHGRYYLLRHQGDPRTYACPVGASLLAHCGTYDEALAMLREELRDKYDDDSVGSRAADNRMSPALFISLLRAKEDIDTWQLANRLLGVRLDGLDGPRDEVFVISRATNINKALIAYVDMLHRKGVGAWEITSLLRAT